MKPNVGFAVAVDYEQKQIFIGEKEEALAFHTARNHGSYCPFATQEQAMNHVQTSVREYLYMVRRELLTDYHIL